MSSETPQPARHARDATSKNNTAELTDRLIELRKEGDPRP